jgi:hypothetical protein
VKLSAASCEAFLSSDWICRCCSSSAWKARQCQHLYSCTGNACKLSKLGIYLELRW